MSQSILFTLLALVLIALSGSRGSALSLLATLFAFWFWKPTRPWGKLGLLLLVLAILVAPLLFSTLVDRFEERSAESLGGRLDLWRYAFLVIRDHLWGGVGLGYGRYAIVDHLEHGMGAYLGARAGLEGQIYLSLHQPVLQVLAETGIPGMLLYVGSLGGALGSFIRQRSRSSTGGSHWLAPYSATVWCVFIGYMLSWLKSGGMASAPSFYLVLALLLIPSRIIEEQAR
jgi:O-antigen ligase